MILGFLSKFLESGGTGKMKLRTCMYVGRRSSMYRWPQNAITIKKAKIKI